MDETPSNGICKFVQTLLTTTNSELSVVPSDLGSANIEKYKHAIETCIVVGHS